MRVGLREEGRELCSFEVLRLGNIKSAIGTTFLRKKIRT
jgi:hypothetical protein